MYKAKYLVLSACLMLTVTGCQADSSAPSKSLEGTNNMTTAVPAFQKVDTHVGTGREAEPGFSVTVHYTGWLYDPSASDKKGKKFDSSLDRKQPFNFYLGAGQVIQGWDEGFAGMKVGGKRTLIIPSEMGYGARGAGGVIPPNATLIFDVELLDVK